MNGAHDGVPIRCPDIATRCRAGGWGGGGAGGALLPITATMSRGRPRGQAQRSAVRGAVRGRAEPGWAGGGPPGDDPVQQGHIRQHMPRTPAGMVPGAVDFVVAVIGTSKTDELTASQ
ncbi:hypothetical protein GCM10009665_11290 [Kitasatospora nipponensis]|uniref:Uncharacterized protein n=1 Tax=Kitasatospora nipponensis TaxID=258049 RepID=A0ABN1VTT8_9ACTN